MLGQDKKGDRADSPGGGEGYYSGKQAPPHNLHNNPNACIHSKTPGSILKTPHRHTCNNMSVQYYVGQKIPKLIAHNYHVSIVTLLNIHLRFPSICAVTCAIIVPFL